MIAPSHLYPSKIVDMNMAGVDASPQSKTLTPASIIVYTRVSFKASALILESYPTEILIS